MDKILEQIKLRDYIKSYDDLLLLDLINSAKLEMMEYCNLTEDNLGVMAMNTIKEMALVKLNKMGSEGLTSESAGLSQNFVDGYPKEIQRRLWRLRRLPCGL